MNDILLDIIDIIVIIYLDDILIYSDNISENKAHIKEVLHRLHANGLFAHADKCEFHITSCKYLRYMLSPEGLTMAPCPDHPRLAQTPESQGCTVLPWFHQLLPSLH